MPCDDLSPGDPTDERQLESADRLHKKTFYLGRQRIGILPAGQNFCPVSSGAVGLLLLM